MKKILIMMGVCAFCLSSCNNYITNPNVEQPTTKAETTTNTSGDLGTSKSNCLVVIKSDGTSASYLKMKKITILNEDEKVVGTGNYWGSYYVPYDGTLTIEWEIRSTWLSSNEFKICTYSFNVASAHELEVEIGADDVTLSYCTTYVRIGGSMIESWNYKDL